MEANTMEANKTTRKVTKTVQVDEEAFTVILNRREAEILRAMAGCLNIEKFVDLVDEEVTRRTKVPVGPKEKLYGDSTDAINEKLFHVLDRALNHVENDKSKK